MPKFFGFLRARRRGSARSGKVKVGWDPRGEEWSKPRRRVSTDKTRRRKFEGGSGACVWPGGEYPRGVDNWMETPAWVWPCGGKRRVLGRLRPAGPGHLSAVGPGTFNVARTRETRRGIWTAARGGSQASWGGRAAAPLQTPPKACGRAGLERRAAVLPPHGLGPPWEGFSASGPAGQPGSENQLRNLAAAGRTVLFRGWGFSPAVWAARAIQGLGAMTCPDPSCCSTLFRNGFIPPLPFFWHLAVSLSFHSLFSTAVVCSHYALFFTTHSHSKPTSVTSVASQLLKLLSQRSPKATILTFHPPFY